MIQISKKYIAIIVFIILSLIWSSTWVAIKIGLETVPPFYSAALRFFIAFLLLSLFGILKGLSFPKRLNDHLFFIRFGLINYLIGYASVYWGEQYINSGLASVLFAIMPFYTLILSIWLLPSETINIKKILGLVIGFVGVVTIFSDQMQISSTNAIYGMIIISVAPAFSATGTLIAKRKSGTYHPVILNTFPIFYCSIAFFLLSLFLEIPGQAVFDTNAILSILYLALFGTAIAFVLYFWMLSHQSAVLMSMITFVTPPMALVWGWFILGEQITEFLVLGLILILTGIFLARK
jgi:drug/metabolite transporter (DMT)-like permease